MRSRLWNREDIRNILWSIYTAQLSHWREPGTQAGDIQKERFFIKGCRVAILTLMMALGLPLESPVPPAPYWKASILPPDAALPPPSPAPPKRGKKGARLSETGSALPPDALPQSGQETPRSGKNPRALWWVEDLENVIAAIYHSAMLTPAAQAHTPQSEAYFEGFKAVISSLLRAIGSRKDTDQWLQQTQAKRIWEGTL
ncbi:MAG: hypothetical protein ACP5OO_09745 [Chloroflexia bacterium]